ncbi:MAG: hypothetical protein AAGI70_08185 [Pseudomonadota bacterium]
MDDDELAGWVMCGCVGVMGLVALALIYMPELRPAAEILACDRQGGFWSSETRSCQNSNSPLAGLAA